MGAHRLTQQTTGAHANIDGHRPATLLSPSANPCETESNPSTGPTDLPLIPENELIQGTSLLPWRLRTQFGHTQTFGI